MVKEKISFELNENVLIKVTGDVTCIPDDVEPISRFVRFNSYCFRNPDTKLKVKYDYRIPVNEPQNIEVIYTNAYTGNCVEIQYKSDYFLFNENYFAGNNAW